MIRVILVILIIMSESLHSTSRKNMFSVVKILYVLASDNMFSVKSLNSTRLVAVLRPGPAQPFPVPSDRGGGGTRFWGPTPVLGGPLLLPETLFFCLQFCWEMKSILLGTKTFACGTSR